MQYFLGGRLLWCYNPGYYPHRYTHVLMRGDQVVCYCKSEAAAEEALKDAQAAAWNEGHKLRLLYEQRKSSTKLRADPGTVVRLPDRDLMYPTLDALRDAVYSQWRLYQSYHVEPLTIIE